MDEKEIKFIQDQIGYTFKNQELLVQAFTRRSYSMENGGQDNEVLEFIGDKALDFVVVKQLSEEFGHYSKKYQNWEKRGKTEKTGTFISDLDEGELTEIKKQLVQKNTLADAIDNLGIAYYLIMGKGDVEKNIQDSLSVKEDLFEAILGAIALDSNWDIEALQDSMRLRYKLGHRLIQETFHFTVSILLPCRVHGICQGIICVYMEKRSRIRTLRVKFKYRELIIISSDTADQRIWPGWTHRDWRMNI